MKNKLNDRVIKWFFGVPGVVDEHVRTEIGQASTKALLGTVIFELLFNAGVCIYATWGPVQNYENLFYQVMLIQFIAITLIATIFTTFSLRRKNVISNEVSTGNQQAVVKRIRKKWLRLAPVIFVMFLLLGTLLNFDGTNFFSKIFAWNQIVGALIFVLLFCPTMYFYEKGNIKVIKNDD